jgi:hypothetical protein
MRSSASNSGSVDPTSGAPAQGRPLTRAATGAGRLAGRGLLYVLKVVGIGLAAVFLYLMSLYPVALLARLEPTGFLRYLYLVLMLGLLIAVVAYMSTQAGREFLRRSGTPTALDSSKTDLRLYFVPLVIASWAVFLALPLFADFTMLLYERGLVDLATTDAAHPVSRGRLADFYLWHLAEFLPVIDIPETLHWPRPVIYTGSWVGSLVLLYQLFVLVPIVLLFRHYRRLARGEGRAVQQTSAELPRDAHEDTR